ncbi:MAG: RsmD family RNA methyltransferase [Campylobacter sp.]|uniref:RsmD family RNA methyltransferase n=1 Tax=Campylobacter sp. TaxID=205 RepID=UPI002AA77043|nr:RsmD family RNA methyltransferase [Campylobacter sp.]MCI6178456.1 RsmD family RNA methyltransferase [Campylobacter sp.]
MQNKQDGYEINIASGALKGRKITLLSSEKTRSTKSIVADSFFDSLRDSVRDSVFAELFGGCGLMAVRALSEGASRAFAFEKDKASFGVLSKNRKNLGLDERFEIFLGDTFNLALDVLNGSKIKNWNSRFILYIDPPFSIREGFDNIYEKCVDLLSKLDPDIAVFEHLSRVTLPKSIGKLTLKKSKKFGKTTLSYFFNEKV